MNYQVRAFQLSFLMHMAILVPAIISGIFMEQGIKATVLDFDLLPSPRVAKVVEAAPAPLPEAKPIKTAALPTVRKGEAPQRSAASLVRPSTVEVMPSATLPETRELERMPMGIGMRDEEEAGTNEARELVGGKQEAPGVKAESVAGDVVTRAARARYLSAHFAYIRDRILRNVTYPEAAKRMGWQGKVVLSFVIAADGSARAFRIIQGSGFKMLDRSAIETVQETAPFPRPPVEAELVIPIVYRLE
ncbi:MAG: TonB family protein [Pseudomonadota bacterium]|nr:TonB family protein [Pseudomonadota bacterium]